MELTIKMKLDNAAFDGPDLVPEIKRVINDYLRKIDGFRSQDVDNTFHSLIDVNGNSVGEARITSYSQEVVGGYNIQDILYQAEREECVLSYDEAEEILYILSERFDASIGGGWDILSDIILDYVKDRDDVGEAERRFRV